MGWGSWFSGKDGDDEASFKVSRDGKDGSFRSERMTRDSDSSEHYHDIAKTSSDGTGYKEICSDKHG